MPTDITQQCDYQQSPIVYHCWSLDTVAKSNCSLKVIVASAKLVKVIVASTKLVEATSNFAEESPRYLMAPPTIQIVLLSENTQLLSPSWLNNYKILLICLHMIQFCYTSQSIS